VFILIGDVPKIVLILGLIVLLHELLENRRYLHVLGVLLGLLAELIGEECGGLVRVWHALARNE